MSIASSKLYLVGIATQSRFVIKKAVVKFIAVFSPQYSLTLSDCLFFCSPNKPNSGLPKTVYGSMNIIAPHKFQTSLLVTVAAEFEVARDPQSQIGPVLKLGFEKTKRAYYTHATMLCTAKGRTARVSGTPQADFRTLFPDTSNGARRRSVDSAVFEYVPTVVSKQALEPRYPSDRICKYAA
ncbi:hypothetical protein A0H81_07809 [Grifola frondosa]|uniref:Uncharacterized protein n=1 Tax=Grifola frondosa TaxID=5627 RepID=A0A1C7M5A4_GRIFR|nr:hypothetical protein A0H81_07809 [Grifola frondosa]